MGLRALVVRKENDEKPIASIEIIDVSDLPDSEVLVQVAYSTVNWKDGLCMGQGGGLVRSYPHVPGIDFSGTVLESKDNRFAPGDKVISTGWRVGEASWGGYAQQARVKADYLVPLPAGLSLRQSMAVGTAGLAAMLGIIALEKQGLAQNKGPVLVTGAGGGVGSIAISILAKLGYQVAAVTGRMELGDYITALGAYRIVERKEVSDTIKKPLESQEWAGCIDAVGGNMLARILGQLQYGCSVAAIGNAGGVIVPASVIPFLLRGINILGVDSATQPYLGRIQAWNRIVSDLPLNILENMVVPASMDELPDLGRKILRGEIKGRVVVDMQK